MIRLGDRAIYHFLWQNLERTLYVGEPVKRLASSASVFEYVEVSGEDVWMRPDGVLCFAGDLSERTQVKIAIAVPPPEPGAR